MLPPLSLDNDSFENLIEEYRSRIAGIFPDWTNYNYSDPGITFLELFAWLRENQQYYMEQLGDDHYREFFRLAGFRPYGRQCARVLAQAVPAARRKAVVIPAGTRFLSGGLSFETTRDEFVPDARIRTTEQVDQNGKTSFSVGSGQITYQGAYSFSPFGAEPVTGASMRLSVEGSIPEGQEFRLAVLLRPNGRNPEAEGITVNLTEISWEYSAAGGYRPLTVVSDETCGLLYSGRITFMMEEGAPADREGLKLRAVLSSGAYDIPPVITGMSLSQIELSQIRSHVWEEGIPLAYGNGFPDQVCEIPQKGFLADSIRIEAADILDPGKMVPWTGTDDFFGCGPEARCFLPEEEAGKIRFGNGWHGMPPEGKIVLKALTETAGSGGNIKTGSIFVPEIRRKDEPEFRLVHTLVPGRDPETREEMLLRIIREKDKVLRAITLEDYEQMVMETPGLCIHSCHAWTESNDPMTVHVVVRPGDGRKPAALSVKERDIIDGYLEERRLIGTRLKLHSPRYIHVDITVEAVPSPQYRNASVLLEKEIREWFDEQKKIYGKPLSYNQLLSRLDSAPYIRKLVTLSMDPRSAGITRDINRALVPPVNGVFLPGNIDVVLNRYQ